MQTRLADFIANTSEGERADAILRSCVHCGFCTATCPTYQLLGDELDGPRGRIYLIKQMLEGKPATAATREHLDRCLTCRSCETTCPSGVQYSELLEIGRAVAEQQAPRELKDKLKRRAIVTAITTPLISKPAIRLGQLAAPLLPKKLQTKLQAKPPARQSATAWPRTDHPRKMVVLQGCVQGTATPNTNAALARILDKERIELLPLDTGCCGAAQHHTSDERAALNQARRNIDRWISLIEAEPRIENIIVSASGCGVHVKDYGRLLANDSHYAERAARIASITVDPIEVLENLDLQVNPQDQTIAFHAPCTLQHGQKLNGRVEALLAKSGFKLVPVTDPHLCCGSAGTYSLLQADIANALRDDKLAKLAAAEPDFIATANVGCQLHLAAGSDAPVVHWLELLDQSCIDT